MNPPPQHSRRSALKLGGLGAIGLVGSDWAALNTVFESAAAGHTDTAPLNRFPRMVQNYFERRVVSIEEAADAARAEITTKEQAAAYVRQAQDKIDRCFGPWPQRTPLNARITGTIRRETYTIENIIFESRPGFLVTGNLYLPKGGSSPRPGVIGVCGHSTNGKAAEAYQAFSQGLARLGYVVFIIDPIGQGERSLYESPHTQGFKEMIPRGVRQHLVAGNQQFLVGDFLGTWRCWDGMRALDYLLTRPEVDPKHIGITGNSGGGTQTTWLCGVECRWTMAAPSCFVTTFSRNLRNELPADTEQCPPKALALSLDHSDFIATMAPKPVILLAKERDYFDARGTETAYARLKRLYSLLGKEENIRLFIGPTTHGYSQENREAMYGFFNGVTGISDQTTEPKLTYEDEEALYCAPLGKVAALESKTVFQFTRAKAETLKKEREPLSYTDLKQVVSKVLRLPKRDGNPDFNILRSQPSQPHPRRHFTTYAVATEPGVHALVYRLSQERHDSRPPTGGSADAFLYVSHHSSDGELETNPSLRTYVEDHPDMDSYTVDLRGIGESRPNTANPNSFLSPYGSDYLYAIHSFMLDSPYVGQKTHDLLRVLDWLHSYGRSKVQLHANGWGTVPATFATLLHDNVVSLELQEPLESFHQLATTEVYDWPLSHMVPGILGHFDLPDCLNAIRERGVTVT